MDQELRNLYRDIDPEDTKTISDFIRHLPRLNKNLEAHLIKEKHGIDINIKVSDKEREVWADLLIKNNETVFDVEMSLLINLPDLNQFNMDQGISEMSEVYNEKAFTFDLKNKELILLLDYDDPEHKTAKNIEEIIDAVDHFSFDYHESENNMFEGYWSHPTIWNEDTLGVHLPAHQILKVTLRPNLQISKKHARIIDKAIKEYRS